MKGFRDPCKAGLWSPFYYLIGNRAPKIEIPIKIGSVEKKERREKEKKIKEKAGFFSTPPRISFRTAVN